MPALSASNTSFIANAGSVSSKCTTKRVDMLSSLLVVYQRSMSSALSSGPPAVCMELTSPSCWEGAGGRQMLLLATRHALGGKQCSTISPRPVVYSIP